MANPRLAKTFQELPRPMHYQLCFRDFEITTSLPGITPFKDHLFLNKIMCDYKIPRNINPPLACIEISPCVGYVEMSLFYYKVLKLDLTPVNAKCVLISAIIACFIVLFLFQ